MKYQIGQKVTVFGKKCKIVAAKKRTIRTYNRLFK